MTVAALKARHILISSVAVFAAFGVIGFGAPAFAADDGEAPLWQGIGGIVGLTETKTQDPIDYRAHGKLVLPPKMVLPPPAAGAAASAAWPQDSDVVRRTKEKAEAADRGPYKPPIYDPKHGNNSGLAGGGPGPGSVTMSATAGQGPTQRVCSNGLKTADCRPPHGIMQALGLSSTPVTELGPEPDRDWLTDPPKGYRAPSSATATGR